MGKGKRTTIPNNPHDRLRYFSDLEKKDTFQNPLMLHAGASNETSAIGLHHIKKFEQTSRRLYYALFGTIAILATAFAYTQREEIKDLFKDKPTAEIVPSQVPLMDTKGNTITDALSYNLSTATHTRQLSDGAGKALLVDVSVLTSDSYKLSTLAAVPQVCTPKSPEALLKGCEPQTQQNKCIDSATIDTSVYCLPAGNLSSDALIGKLASLKNTPNEFICASELSSLVDTVKVNAENFANDSFSAIEISSASTIHETSVEPFTKIPMPAIRNEIIFVQGDTVLSCR